jgi:hypothetical protein
MMNHSQKPFVSSFYNIAVMTRANRLLFLTDLIIEEALTMWLQHSKHSLELRINFPDELHDQEERSSAF